MSSDLTQATPEYRDWLAALKTRFRHTQLKAAQTINRALLQFYWELGADIVARQAGSQWGDGFLKLATDLMQEFPEVKGFSASNLKYIRQWYAFYAGHQPIGQQPVAQLNTPAIAKQPVSQLPEPQWAGCFAIPWGHHLAILAKCKFVQAALAQFRHATGKGYSPCCI